MIKKFRKRIIESKTYRETVDRLKSTSFRKERVPIYKVINTLYKNIIKRNVHQEANAIAFSFLLSLFPAILFLFTLIPLLPIPNLHEQVNGVLAEVMPEAIYGFMKESFIDIVKTPQGGLLSFGFLFALYAATNGVNELMVTFNRSYEYSEKRNFLKRRLIAILLAILLAFLLTVAIAVLIIGHFLIDWLRDNGYLAEDFIYYLVIFIKYTLVFLVFWVGISFVYYIAPAVSNHWRFFSLGSIIASVSAILITNLFSFYLSHFATYNKVYGSIGTLIALMLWLYVLAWVLIIGFEINSSISEAKIEHQKEMQEKYNLLDDIMLSDEGDIEGK